MTECKLYANMHAHKNNYKAPCPRQCVTNTRMWVSAIAIIISTCITSESQSRAAGMATPAAERSHWAAAASVWVFPLAPGWNVRPDRFGSCSWERGPRRQPAAVGSAAEASAFHTSYSPGAWSAGGHKESVFQFTANFAITELHGAKTNPGRIPWKSLFSKVLTIQHMRRTTLEVRG